MLNPVGGGGGARPVNAAWAGGAGVQQMQEGSGPIGEPPEGSYCAGVTVYKNNHAIKRVKTLAKPPKEAMWYWCYPLMGKEKPPHDGTEASWDKKKDIGWEAEILLKVEIDALVGLMETRWPYYVQYFKDNLGHMYIYQEIRRVTTLYSGRNRPSRVVRHEFFEVFLLDEWGRSVVLDPHVGGAEYADHCKLHAYESADLELIWKKPKAGSGKKNEGFEFYGDNKYWRGVDDAKWKTEHERADVEAGMAGFDVVHTGVGGYYSETYDIDHCREKETGLLVPSRGPVTPGGGRTPTPPDRRGGTATPRDGEGASVATEYSPGEHPGG